MAECSTETKVLAVGSAVDGKASLDAHLGLQEFFTISDSFVPGENAVELSPELLNGHIGRLDLRCRFPGRRGREPGGHLDVFRRLRSRLHCRYKAVR